MDSLKSMVIEYKPIGVIHTPFDSPQDMPIQPAGAMSVPGTIDVFPEYSAGLKDLDGFSHAMLLYHFHRAVAAKLVVMPFLDSQPHGVFATRAPVRPNSIGISVVKLVKLEDLTINVENIDILDGTPLLDIKPYVPEFDHHPADRIGWLEEAKGASTHKKADNRFS